MLIFLDIETIPSQDPDVCTEIEAEVQPPANMKKPETIAAWEQNDKPAQVEEKWRKTSFAGDRGEIVAISWAINNERPQIAYRGLDQDEKSLLGAFFKLLDRDINEPGKPATPTWVGHNVKDFDLRFLFQRAVINGIKPPVHLPHDARPGSKEVFDTMTAWAGFGNRISLDRLCKAFGIQTKDELDGSLVWDYIRDGREQEVAEYCKADVERVRQVYNRLTFGRFASSEKAA